MSSPHHHSITIAADTQSHTPSYDMHLTCWGDASKPVALCVHGLSRNGRDFDDVAKALMDDFYVICPDIVGRGKSSWFDQPAFYQNPVYVAGIGQMLLQMKISELIWVGTSMGGIMAMMAANMLPALKLRGVVLNDVGCMIPADGLSRIGIARGLPKEFNSRHEAETAYVQRCATFGIEDDAHWQHLFQHGLVETPDGKWRYTYDPNIFEAFATPINEDVDLWPLWSAMQNFPVLLLRGEESDILLHETALAMQEKHPNLRYEAFAGVGHAPALMADKQIAPIQSWMSAIS